MNIEFSDKFTNGRCAALAGGETVNYVIENCRGFGASYMEGPNDELFCVRLLGGEQELYSAKRLHELLKMTQAERGLFEQLEQYLNPGEKAGSEAEKIIREFEQRLAEAERRSNQLAEKIERIVYKLRPGHIGNNNTFVAKNYSIADLIAELTAPLPEQKA